MSRWRRKSQEDDQDADAVARWDAFQNMLGAAQENDPESDFDAEPAAEPGPPRPPVQQPVQQPGPPYGSLQSPWTNPPPPPWAPSAQTPPSVSWQVPGPPGPSTVPPWRAQSAPPPDAAPATDPAGPAAADPPPAEDSWDAVISSTSSYDSRDADDERPESRAAAETEHSPAVEVGSAVEDGSAVDEEPAVEDEPAVEADEPVGPPPFLSDLSDLSAASWTSARITLPGDALRSRGNDSWSPPSGNGTAAEPEAPADEVVAEAPVELVAEAPAEEVAVSEPSAQETLVAEVPVEVTPVDEVPVDEDPVAQEPAEDDPIVEPPVRGPAEAQPVQMQTGDVPLPSGQQRAVPPQQWQSAPVAEPAYGWSQQPPQPAPSPQQVAPPPPQPAPPPQQPAPPARPPQQSGPPSGTWPAQPGWQQQPPYPPQQQQWQPPPGWQPPVPPQPGPPPQQWPARQPQQPRQGPPPQQQPQQAPPQRPAEPQPPETPPFVWNDQFQRGQRAAGRPAPSTGSQPAVPPQQPPASPQQSAQPRRPQGLTPYQLAGPPSPAPTRPSTGPDELSAEALIAGRRSKNAGGWRKAVSGISVRPGHARAEQRRRDLIAQATVPVHGCYRIAVISLKGGVGKTTSTVCIGATLASLRGDRVIAVDANPDRGTLSGKIPLQTTATVRNLLNDVDHIQTYSDVRRYTSQSPDRLEVLASESDPSVSLAFGEEDYRRVAGVLERFYNVVLTDCGTGLLHSAMAGVLSLADQIVVVSSGSVDGARSASATLDWLEAHGYSQLVAGGLAVINSVRPRSGGVNIDALESHFASRCRSVTRIPYDAHLELGAEVDLAELNQSTRDALLELAAQVTAGFPAQLVHGFGAGPQQYAPPPEQQTPLQPDQRPSGQIGVVQQNAPTHEAPEQTESAD